MGAGVIKDLVMILMVWAAMFMGGLERVSIGVEELVEVMVEAVEMVDMGGAAAMADMAEVGEMAAMGGVELEEEEKGKDEDSMAMVWSRTGKQIRLQRLIRMLLPKNIKINCKVTRSGIRLLTRKVKTRKHKLMRILINRKRKKKSCK